MNKIKNLNELNDKLKINYENECKQYLTNLKTKGFIILVDDAGNKHIWQYKANAKEFVKSKYTIASMVDEMLQNVKNYYDIPTDYDFYFSILHETIPAVTVDELNSFYDYNKAVNNIKSDKELKAELKELNAVIRDRSRKINPTNDDVYEQMQVLVNAGIVACDVSTGSIYRKIKYYQYSKSEQRFIEKKEVDIKELIEKTLNTKVHEGIVHQHMQKDWYTYGISSNLPKKWNDNIDYQKTIYEQENNKLNTIINSFN